MRKNQGIFGFCVLLLGAPLSTGTAHSMAQTPTTSASQKAPPSPARKCSRIYKPVCGVMNGQKQTFSNSCMAETHGAKIVHTVANAQMGGLDCRNGVKPYSACSTTGPATRLTGPHSMHSSGYSIKNPVSMPLLFSRIRMGSQLGFSISSLHAIC